MKKLLGIILLCVAPTTIACAQSPVEMWKANMLSYGEKYCQVGDNYYDGARVYYQIAQYTGNSKWERCAETALHSYVDSYLVSNNYAASGWMIFPHGLVIHYQRTGDEKSKQAVLGLAEKAAFSYAPVEWTAPSTTSREVAYNLEAKLLAEPYGYKDSKRIEELVNQALAHYDKWFISKTAPYVQPFMAGLTAEALIMWYEKTKDPRVLPILKAGADWMWSHMWLPDQLTFKYTNRPEWGEGPAPDLNLLIAPLYGWIYKITGDIEYRKKGDKIFEGGVNFAYLEQSKQFNQNYRWSFSYVAWREHGDSREK